MTSGRPLFHQQSADLTRITEPRGLAESVYLAVVAGCAGQAVGQLLGARRVEEGPGGTQELVGVGGAGRTVPTGRTWRVHECHVTCGL